MKRLQPSYRNSRPDYNRKLSRALMLADGRRLVTLRAAAIVMSELKELPSPSARDLDRATALLLMAGESGTPADVVAFTDEVERVLLGRQLLRQDEFAPSFKRRSNAMDAQKRLLNS